MKKEWLTFILIVTFNFISAQKLKAEYKDMVTNFINYIKNDNQTALKSIVRYPLKRAYPISSIKNEKDFVSRYNQIFDTILINKIITSNINKDWSAMGWRGIMLNQGDLWLDYDGKLIAVNYQSNAEQEEKKRLIDNDKKTIHSSLKVFKIPAVVLETKKFRIRIDELENGFYRYASWSINSEMNEKPDLILKNGELNFDGSGGNHNYKFVNGHYTYKCFINKIRTKETAPASLIVYKNDDEILVQSAEIIN